MTIYLKQSTASQEILIGMMISSTDGITPATGLSVANTDIQIWRAGAITMANKNSGGATEIGTTGYYYATLDATDTATLGSLIINVNIAGALMWRGEFVVVTANWYDTMCGSDVLDVSLTQVNGAAQTATLDTIKAETVLIVEDTGTTLPGTLTTIAGYVDTEVASILAAVDTEIGTLGTELAKVPKSDSTVTWNDTALASINTQVDLALNTAIPASNTATSVNDVLLDVLTLAAINAEMDTALNTAIPGSPTSDSINERVKAIDDLTQASGAGDLAAILTDTGTTLDTLVKDIPTVAEFEARTIAAADYLVAGDTLARVTLVDTCTVNSDMRGTDSAALASVCTETRLAELDAANIPADLDAVLADTNELELDWKNGGRLDLILDAASAGGVDYEDLADAVWDEVLNTGHAVGNSAAVILSGILVDTAEIGTAGAGLTAVPYNAAWDAEIQSEVADALAAYDPPTNTEMEARTLPAADYVVTTDTIARVALVDVCTLNSDMRGTNSAALASVCTETRLAELDAANLPTDIDNIYDDIGDVKTVVDAVLVDTGTTLQGDITLILEDTGTTIPATITALDTLIDRILGLNHENFRISSPVFADGNMTSCTVKIYPTATDCTNDTSVLATYNITATYDISGNLATYKSVKA